MSTTKNLGQVASLKRGVTPPTNVSLLWFDTNTGVNKLKFYNSDTSSWEVAVQSALNDDKNEVFPFTNQNFLDFNHTVGKLPSVTIIDDNGYVIGADIQLDLVDQTRVIITFNSNLSGFVILN
jgi:hypothetical protein